MAEHRCPSRSGDSAPRPDFRTRLEHQLDTRSVSVAAWLYRRTHGRIGRLWRRDVLLLTTTGRRTGRPRTVPLQYFPDGDDLLIVAANSGLASHPAWYHNLTAQPRAHVEVGDLRVAVTAAELSACEAEQFWPTVLERAPDYARYPERTSRRLPILRLTPVAPTGSARTAAAVDVDPATADVMTAVVQDAYGDPDGLTLTTVERPEPGPDEVLVAVRAAAISPGDRAMITGVPLVNRLAAGGLRRPKRPVPGFDCAGTVSATGDAVTAFEVGDRVFGNAPGSLAQYALGSADQLAIIPDRCSFTEAAAVPESGCVALQAVRDHGRPSAGQRVAVIGAGGGVGSYVVQLAKAAQAHVTGLCGARMLEAVRELGADVVSDDRSHFATTDRVYDVIIDTAGTTPLRELRRTLAPQGRLVIVGADLGHRVTGGLGRWLRALLWNPFVAPSLRPFVARPLNAEDLGELVDLIETGQLRPCVDRTFPLDAAADAMEYLDHRTRPGKVVVTQSAH
jgi:deazaflavin-dependent oxidoreductase (nitroreductase family)